MTAVLTLSAHRVPVTANIAENFVPCRSVSDQSRFLRGNNTDKVSAAADNHLASVFKFAVDVKENPRVMGIELKTIPGADEAIIKKSVEKCTSCIEGLGKLSCLNKSNCELFLRCEH
ncbi:Secreted RxLR effector peptide protein [Phytophthora palmivora]|uniref:Secreted RxLR effector peptide protein n=1 Tax=Phytophthora palmivora TaxID=4796 RepID=A0A2P4XB03_9STRA|nr:Secreted RxLR effector peptide protein [Phytophthora palmivora]